LVRPIHRRPLQAQPEVPPGRESRDHFINLPCAVVLRGRVDELNAIRTLGHPAADCQRDKRANHAEHAAEDGKPDHSVPRYAEHGHEHVQDDANSHYNQQIGEQKKPYALEHLYTSFSFLVSGVSPPAINATRPCLWPENPRRVCTVSPGGCAGYAFFSPMSCLIDTISARLGRTIIYCHITPIVKIKNGRADDKKSLTIACKIIFSRWTARAAMPAPHRVSRIPETVVSSQPTKMTVRQNQK
jgi:hypothetical protein